MTVASTIAEILFVGHSLVGVELPPLVEAALRRVEVFLAIDYPMGIILIAHSNERQASIMLGLTAHQLDS